VRPLLRSLPMLAVLILAPATLRADEPQQPTPRPAEVSLDVEEVLRALEQSPSIERVQRWAIAEARVSPERASRLVRRARARGALPLVRVRGRYEDQTRKQWDELDLIDRRDRDMDYTLDLWLEWDLAELASGPDVLRAVREGRALAELRQGVITQVTIAYFDRRRLLAEGLLSDPAEPPERAILRRLRIQELDATIDGLTGGRWSDALERARSAEGAERQR
jgi:hypothetical protein